jgi:Putative Actinobacterial Holin-X, holin superfamily III
MEQQEEGIIEGIIGKVEGYGKTSIALAKLKAVQKIIPLATVLTSQIFVAGAFAMFALLVNVGISLWLGDLLGKPWYGFLAVAGFYLLLAVVLHFVLAKWLRKPVSRFIIKQTLN